MILRNDIINKVTESMVCRNRLAYEMNVHAITVKRWLKSNNIMLTTALALLIISEELGEPKDQLLVRPADSIRATAETRELTNV